MSGAVADGERVGQLGTAELVDQHTVTILRTGGQQRGHCRDDAYSDNHHVGRKHAAILQLHAGYPPVCADQLFKHHA
ncbi:hypothetical protein D3C85_1697420 [compost metagenome]